MKRAGGPTVHRGDRLGHEFEEKEKQLLDISERLGLKRGGLDPLWPGLVLACFLLLSLVAQAQDGWRTAQGWVELLDAPERSAEARDEILRRGKASLPILLAHAEKREAPLIERGYCLALLAELEPPADYGDRLRKLSAEDPQPLVRRWAGAARLQTASGPAELLDLLQSAPGGVAAIERPAAMLLQGFSGRLTLEQAMSFAVLAPHSQSSPSLAGVSAPVIRQAGPPALAELMFTSKDVNVRRTSAGLLSGLAQKQRAAVMTEVLERLAVDPNAKQVPWEGGALFLPQVQFEKGEARALIRSLVRWYQWAEKNKADNQVTQPIENNLRSYNLWQIAGGGNLGWRNAKGAQQWAKLLQQLEAHK